MPYKHRFGPFANELYRVPMAYPYRWPGGAEHCAEQALRTVTDQIHAQVGEDNTAAVIIEPVVQGASGRGNHVDDVEPGRERLARAPSRRQPPLLRVFAPHRPVRRFDTCSSSM